MNNTKKILILLGLFLQVFIISCSKEHKFRPAPQSEDGGIAAEFQINWFVPTPTSEINKSYADSLFINDIHYYDEKSYAMVGGIGSPFRAYSGYPPIFNTKPLFFGLGANWKDNIIPPCKIHFLKEDKLAYEFKLSNLERGKKYNFVFYDRKKSPLAIDNKYPYFSSDEKKKTHCSIMFVNVLFSDMSTKYNGICQYQYSIQGEGEGVWHNLGSPVKFGESTERIEIELKDAFNTISFRILDENGNEIKRKDSEIISESFTFKPGESYIHFLGGLLTDNGNIYPWRSI